MRLKRAFALLLLFGLALGLRVHHAQHTVVSNPVAGDAAQYYLYAWNLANRGVFSKSLPGADPVVPDDFRSPGYPLFLAAAMVGADDAGEWRDRVILWQALLGSVAVLLIFGIAARALPWSAAYLAALLYAGWPHAVVMPTYLLSETLFGFSLALAAWLTTRAYGDTVPSTPLAAGAGLAWAFAYLVNPVVLPFAVALGVGLAARRTAPTAARRAGLVMLALVLAAPMALAMRSATLPETGQPGRFALNLVQGSHPLYHEAYAAHGNPDADAVLAAIDAEAAAFDRDPVAGLRTLATRFALEPGPYATWYAWRKPTAVFGWNIAVGQGDLFVQDTVGSPFQTDAGWAVWRSVARAANPILAALAIGYAAIVLFRLATRRPTSLPLAIAAGLVACALLVHVALQADARYGIPFRGFEILLAVAAIAAAVQRLRAERAT